MKHLYTALLALFISFSAAAQLPDGSIAPDFTAEDINGVEHNLYSLLDQGKRSSSTSPPPGAVPAGTTTTPVPSKRSGRHTAPTEPMRPTCSSSKATTPPPRLTWRNGNATTGNWIEGTGYPIIDNGGSIFDDYAGAYYPTIYTVCPNRMLVESSQISPRSRRHPVRQRLRRRHPGQRRRRAELHR